MMWLLEQSRVFNSCKLKKKSKKWKKKIPMVEKNDLSPHSATKTKAKVLITVLAAATIPAPFPDTSAIASSAWFQIRVSSHHIQENEVLRLYRA